MPDWSPERVAAAAGATLATAPDHARPGPRRAAIDSRDAAPGDLFAGLVGEHVDGGRFAPDSLRAGAWGVLVGPAHAEAATAAAAGAPDGVVLVADDPLAALQRLATAWRRELACPVVGVTGSVGKTSTKDLLAAMLAPALRVRANRLNLNTEIGLPLTILGAPRGTEALVLEMGMRGAGQISELAAIAQPDVGVITAIAPVHLEQLGTLEAIAAEKAALVAALPAGGTAVVPAGEALLAAHLRPALTTVTFGPGGDVDEADLAGLELPFTAAHMRRNACAALAAARALGVEPAGRVDVRLSELRGQRITLPGRITVINDCYNANPVSMRAALDDLAASAGGRRVAVLGDMRELGPDEARFHEEIGRYARERGVEVLVAVGPLSRAYAADHHLDTAADAAALVPGLLHEGDTLLVKASRGIGLEAVAEALA
ncbi:MAG: UDP-N-acetylmuramoyl-tripeptide--D-alanyl-D-alanine ligase [Solirubrobacteraceae bacterium]|nr:UDP-N-acetylmuramoyl-tripeptide--D-alanyl-D-alanine ligase [Solirubrobacteraceae bacterium]